MRIESRSTYWYLTAEERLGRSMRMHAHSDGCRCTTAHWLTQVGWCLLVPLHGQVRPIPSMPFEPQVYVMLFDSGDGKELRWTAENSCIV